MAEFDHGYDTASGEYLAGGPFNDTGGGGTVLLTSTATAAQINAAWTSSIHTVFLAPGTYDENGGGGMTTQITVPAGKRLVGSVMEALEDTSQNGQVRMEWSTAPTGGAITLEEGAAVHGVHVIKTGTLATEPGIAAEIGPTVYSSYEVIDCHSSNWSVGFEFPLTSSGSGTTGIRLRGCVADACTNGFEVRFVANATDERVMIEVSHCVARDITSVGFNLSARAQSTTEADVYAHFTYNQAIDCGSHGFTTSFSSSSFGPSRGHVHFLWNHAEGNGGDGFDFGTAAHGAPVFVGNTASNNTGVGIRIDAAGGSLLDGRLGIFALNEAFGNTAGDIDYGTVGSFNTYTLQTLNRSGVQSGPGVVLIEAGAGVTAGQLQDLLDMESVHTVLLADQGTSGDAVIALGTTSLNIPDNKRLIGSSRALADITSAPFAGQVRFTYTGTGTAIVVNDGAHVQGVQVGQVGTIGTGVAFSLGGACGTIEGCYADDFATGFQVSTTAIYLTQITHCKSRDCTTGFLQNASVSTELKCVIEYCVAENGTTGFDIDGSTNGFVQVVGCTATNCSGDGFNQRGIWGFSSVSSVGYVHLRGCHASNCGGEGFDLDGFAHGRTMVTDCRATNCTGTGFACALGYTAEEQRPYIGNCVAAGNGTDLSIDGTWAKGPIHFITPTGGTSTNEAPDAVERLLAFHSALDLRSTGSTTLLTAKTSEVVIITKVEFSVRSYNDTSAFTTDPFARIDGTGTGDIIPNEELTGIAVGGSVNDMYVMRTAGKITKVSATNTVSVQITAAGGGTILQADVHVWGYIARI